MKITSRERIISEQWCVESYSAARESRLVRVSPDISDQSHATSHSVISSTPALSPAHLAQYRVQSTPAQARLCSAPLHCVFHFVFTRPARPPSFPVTLRPSREKDYTGPVISELKLNFIRDLEEQLLLQTCEMIVIQL